MNKEKYEKTDLLMISDFIMDTVYDFTIKKIEQAKINNNKFYSLSIVESKFPISIQSIFDNE